MFKDNREDFHEELSYVFLSLIPKKVAVGVVGGGRGAYIKCRTLSSHGCNVTVIARDFIEEFNELHGVKLLQEEYKEGFIEDKHLIIIAINDSQKIQEIICQCELRAKLYINASNYAEGMGTIPAQNSQGNISFAINTKGGNPKAALMIKSEIREVIKEYDEFIGFINGIRNRAKRISEYKQEIISFIATEDYKFMWEKGKEEEALRLFFPKEHIDRLLY